MEGGFTSFKRSCKRFASHHIRQLGCLDAVLRSLPGVNRLWKRGQYQTLGQQEDDEQEGSIPEDLRQSTAEAVGQVFTYAAFVVILLTFILPFLQVPLVDPVTKELVPLPPNPNFPTSVANRYWYRQNATILLYVGAAELLVCGACCRAAASMYKRRSHIQVHPAEASEQLRSTYLKVVLEKDPMRPGRQLYGLGYRPSTDGLECLHIEDIRPGSLLERWNDLRRHPNPLRELESGLEEASGQPSSASISLAQEQMWTGWAVVAVNDVHADLGLMQSELTKDKVTLWVLPEELDQSRSDGEVEHKATSSRGPPRSTTIGASSIEEQDEEGGLSRPPPCSPQEEKELPPPDTSAASSGPKCAVRSLEDEEPQILVRWLCCAILVGWVLLVPILLMQPHPERPRQLLLRQYLLKPCLFILPLWVLIWLLDSLQVVLEMKLLPPFPMFLTCHTVLPAILVFFVFRLQAADEGVVLEQRESREADLRKSKAEDSPAERQPAVVEDPSPTFLRELIFLNPVALVFVGSVAAFPIVLFNMLTPMRTERARLAQGYVNMMYGPLILSQIGTLAVVWSSTFWETPKLYFLTLGLMLNVPVMLIWCGCLLCASRYGRYDMMHVEQQRAARARQALKLTPDSEKDADLVDLTEDLQRHAEYLYSV